MSKLNSGSATRSILIVIIILFAIFGAWWFMNNKYQQKMIKLDACLESCIGEKGVGSGLLGRSVAIRGCEAECREKYGTTEEEYNKWKDNAD